MESSRPVFNHRSATPGELAKRPQVMVPSSVARVLWDLRDRWLADKRVVERARDLLTTAPGANPGLYQVMVGLLDEMRTCTKDQIYYVWAAAPKFIEMEPLTPGVNVPTSQWEFTRIFPPVVANGESDIRLNLYDVTGDDWIDGKSETFVFRFDAILLDRRPGAASDARPLAKVVLATSPSSGFDIVPEERERRRIYPERIQWRPPGQGGPNLIYNKAQLERQEGSPPTGVLLREEEEEGPEQLNMAWLMPNVVLRASTAPVIPGTAPPELIIEMEPVYADLEELRTEADPVQVGLSALYKEAFDSMLSREAGGIDRLLKMHARCLQARVQYKLRMGGTRAYLKVIPDPKLPVPVEGQAFYRAVYVETARVTNLDEWVEGGGAVAAKIRVRVSYRHPKLQRWVTSAREFLIDDDSWVARSPKFYVDNYQRAPQVTYNSTPYPLYQPPQFLPRHAPVRD